VSVDSAEGSLHVSEDDLVLSRLLLEEDIDVFRFLPRPRIDSLCISA
jgi:hypothetical protein